MRATSSSYLQLEITIRQALSKKEVTVDIGVAHHWIVKVRLPHTSSTSMVRQSIQPKAATVTQGAQYDL